jgi:hypothetical protein
MATASGTWNFSLPRYFSFSHKNLILLYSLFYTSILKFFGSIGASVSIFFGSNDLKEGASRLEDKVMGSLL